MIPYILQVTINLTVCLGFYKMFLQKETFYRLNRWVLLTCLAVAFVLPLLTVPARWSLFPGLRQSLTGEQPLSSTGDRQSSPSEDQRHASTGEPQTSLSGPLQTRTSGEQPASLSRDQQSPSTGPSSSSRADIATIPPAGRIPSSPGNTMDPIKLPPTRTQHPPESVTPAHSETLASSGNGQPLKVDLLQWLYYGYIFGVAIAAISLLFQIAILLIQAYARPVVKDGRYRIVEMTGDHAPCSFANNIFINPTRYDWETYQQILLHEKIHASGWHTLDILLAELCIVIHWFNPFAWRYRTEVENNLEFLTDQAVLRDPGIERTSYQLSLLKVSAPNMPLSITSNYNQSLLKRRIIMMNAKHSSLHTVWKYFFLLPLLVFLVCALNHPGALAQSAGSSKKGTKTASAQHPDQKRSLQTGNSNNNSSTSQSVNSTDTQIGKETVTTAADTASPLNMDFRLDMDLALDVSTATVQTETITTTTPVPAVNVSPRIDVQLSPMNVEPSMNINHTFGNRLGGDTSKPHSRADRRQGSWFATTKDDKLCIEFKGDNEEHSWSNNTCILKTEFTGLGSTGKVEFRLVREAGAMTFTGQFDGDQGFGHYTFQPDAEYAAHLRQSDLALDDNDLVTFFFLNIKKDYVAMLQANGYPHISKNHVISMAAMKIDEPFIRSWKDLGYTDLSEDRLISAKAMHLDRAYVEDLRKAGYDHLPMEKLISFKAMGIDGDYVRKLNPASPLSPNDLITYKSLKVDSAYVASLKRAGYSDIPGRDLVTLRSLNINGEFIQGFKDIGYTDIPVHSLVTLKSMHVTPEYIKGFRDIGYQDIPVNTLVSIKSLGITPEYVKGFKEIGYKDVPLESLNSLKALGITPAFVKDFNSIGFKNIPLNQLHSLKALGVTADYVSKMREKGFVSDDLQKYIRLKNASF